MNRQNLINSTIKKIRQLPDKKIMEIKDYVDFLLSRVDDRIISEGIHEYVSDSKSFDFLNDEEDLYSVDDLKERFK